MLTPVLGNVEKEIPDIMGLAPNICNLGKFLCISKITRSIRTKDLFKTYVYII
jgi:hypothetical protein